MDRILYQSVCSGQLECMHVKDGKSCAHSTPLRRKDWAAVTFACPYDAAKKHYEVARCSCRKNEYIRWRALCHPSLSRNMEEPMTKEMSKKFNRCYGVFRRARNSGILEGYCESSFYMKWDVSRVMPVSLGEANEILRIYHKNDNKTIKHRREYDIFIVRITASGKNNPVIIDWSASKNEKYKWRNILFRRKKIEHVSPVVLPEELKNPVF